MPAYGDCRTAEIRATPQACFDALTDYERLPQWQGAVRKARVLERDAYGRGTIVEYEVDARIKRVRYRLRQLYDEPVRLGSEYLGGDFRSFAGEWRLKALDGRSTRVEHSLGAGIAMQLADGDCRAAMTHERWVEPDPAG